MQGHPGVLGLNADMGEGTGSFRYGDDEGLAPFLHMANVACGWHAGDPTTIAAAVRLARTSGITIGGHPSLPDREGFGRRVFAIDRETLRNCLLFQLGALKGILDWEGLPMSYLKPHGKLYSMAGHDEEIADGLCDAAECFGLAVVGMAGTVTETVCRRRNRPFIAEFFADLDYRPDGFPIVAKERPVDLDWLARRLRQALRERTVVASGGTTIPMPFGTICIHSDMPNAADVARVAREAFDAWAQETAAPA